MSDDKITITFTADELLDYIDALNGFFPDSVVEQMQNLLEMATELLNRIPLSQRSDKTRTLQIEGEQRQARANALVALRRRLTG